MASLTFDRDNKLVIVDSPAVSVSIQAIYDAVRGYEDDLTSLDLTKIVDGFGKQNLGGGLYVATTLVLLDGWKLQFEARGAPDTVACLVTGGNLVSEDASNPIEPSAYTQVTIAQSTSAAFLEGSGVTAADVADAVWDEAMSGHATSGTFGLQIGRKLLTFAKWLGLK